MKVKVDSWHHICGIAFSHTLRYRSILIYINIIISSFAARKTILTV